MATKSPGPFHFHFHFKSNSNARHRALAFGKVPAVKILMRVLLLVTLLPLNACIPLVITASVTAIDVSLDRRTPGKYLDDNTLELKLRNDFGLDPALGADVNISVTSFNGIVLLTGEVNSDEQRQRASVVAEQYKTNGEVASVANELTLAGKTNLTSRLNDIWITGKVKARLLKTPDLPASAIKVVTEHGKSYLLGRVTNAEADAAVNAIRDIRGITHIVKVFEYID